MILTLFIGSGLGFGAYLYFRPEVGQGSTLETVFNVADQRLKEARDLEIDGELTLARLKYTQARDLFERQGNQEKLNQANEGINRTLKLAQDYSLDTSALQQLLAQKIEAFRTADFNKWELNGQLDCRYIDGQKRYAVHTVENLAFQDAEVARRLIGWNAYYEGLMETLLPYALAPSASSITQSWRNSLAFTVNSQLHLNYTKLPPYQTVRCWSPFPILTPSQTDIQLITAQADEATFFPPWSDPETGIVYLEMKNSGNHDLNMRLVYSFKTKEISLDINPNLVGSYDTNQSLYQRYTRSEPHLEISEQMQELAVQITAREENPYHKAQKVYQWMLQNIRPGHVSYPLVLASSASHYCLEHKMGDSTLQAFLFATLCRSTGIPARVVSGYLLVPGYEKPWSWAEFYLPYYGWVPADPAMAKTMSLAPQLKEEQRQRVETYYLGHLDPYRLILNQTSPAALSPTKKTERNMSLFLLEPEAEAGGKNIPVEAIKFTLTFQRQ